MRQKGRTRVRPQIPEPGRRPLFHELETPAGRIAMTHGHLTRAPVGNKPKMLSHFRAFNPDIIIFGHTHVPYLDALDGVTFFNPGVAGRIRTSHPPSVGLIRVEAPGEPAVFEHVEL